MRYNLPRMPVLRFARTSNRILPGAPSHWNSPIVVDGHVIEPEGDANDHQLSGTLDLLSVG